ncbi:hypothetical protein AHF37_05306 [Paragonimus kellicotti]|nr:hypothetical protein AHF37_05306 [Paragonimus kellicotti]
MIRTLRYVWRTPVAGWGFLPNNVCSDSCNIWYLTRRRVTQVPNKPVVMTDGLFSGLTIKPKLIVFDLGLFIFIVPDVSSLSVTLLDLTLWPFDCDDFVGHKFHKKGAKVFDSNGEAVNVCPDSNYLLESIKNEDGVLLACASRTVFPESALQLIRAHDWDKLFDVMEIYPSSKVKHFNALAKKTGVSFNEMLFFDDLHWNIDEVSRLGVHAHLVKNGINTGLVRRALQAYEQAHKSRNTGV